MNIDGGGGGWGEVYQASDSTGGKKRRERYKENIQRCNFVLNNIRLGRLFNLVSSIHNQLYSSLM